MGERGSVVVVGVRGAAEGGHGLIGHGYTRQLRTESGAGLPFRWWKVSRFNVEGSEEARARERRDRYS